MVLLQRVMLKDGNCQKSTYVWTVCRFGLAHLQTKLPSQVVLGGEFLFAAEWRLGLGDCDGLNGLIRRWTILCTGLGRCDGIEDFQPGC